MKKELQTWKYDNAIPVAQTPPIDCIALADLKLRATPEDPESLIPPKAQPIGAIKAGTKFQSDKLILMGSAATPSYPDTPFARAIWYRTIPAVGVPEGYVLGYFQAPANTGKPEVYVGTGDDGLMTWAGIQAANDLIAKEKKGSGSSKPSTTPATPATPPPFTKPPVDGAKAGMTPLLIIAVLAAVYLFTQKGK